jgi:hypothetical protein
MTSNQELFDIEMGTPPPTAVDVDRVIARELRRVRYRKIGVGAVVGVTVAAFAFGFTVLSRAGSHAPVVQPATAPKATAVTSVPAPTHTSAPAQSSAPSPVHTPPPTGTAGRLTAALAQLPAAMHVPKDAAFSINDNFPSLLYDVSWPYNGVNYHIEISQGDKPDPKVNGCAPRFNGNPPLGDCTQEVSSTGITIEHLNPYHAQKFWILFVDFTMNDGTVIEVSANDPHGQQTLTSSLMPTLVAAAHVPGFTLHP